MDEDQVTPELRATVTRSSTEIRNVRQTVEIKETNLVPKIIHGPELTRLEEHVLYQTKVGEKTKTVWRIDRHGERGATGLKGDKGDTGDIGPGATISIGNVLRGLDAEVTNVGTPTAAIFDFVLPKGDTGDKGDKGDKGDPGTPGTSFETFTYSAPTAATQWTITHNLNCYPSVTVVDSAGTVIVPDVDYVDINTITVTFAYAMAGVAYLN